MNALTTKKLDRMLQNNPITKRFYLGTFPSCISPVTNKTKFSFITNTQGHELGGAHWCGWMVNGKTIIFFDSFGRDPTDPAFPQDYKDIIRNYRLKYNNVQLQDFSSNACGYYCMHFLYILSLGLDLDFMLSDYSSDFKNNDIVVYNLIDKI
tara:strand:- start:86 stop:541 length:456 start_codon:yes stop_codon:yes gene_type:complete